MNPTALIAGIAIGAALTGTASADVSLDDLNSRVQQLETNAACVQTQPITVAQEHGTRKWMLVTTNATADALEHPGRYEWLETVKPSCVTEAQS